MLNLLSGTAATPRNQQEPAEFQTRQVWKGSLAANVLCCAFFSPPPFWNTPGSEAQPLLFVDFITISNRRSIGAFLPMPPNISGDFQRGNEQLFDLEGILIQPENWPASIEMVCPGCIFRGGKSSQRPNSEAINYNFNEARDQDTPTCVFRAGVT